MRFKHTTTSAGAYPAGLTRREVEVLRLIAQGLTDAQVAERLVISAHTVHAHLRAIYGKLEVTSLLFFDDTRRHSQRNG
jgi:DNA-binding NarL/FixJ family response regulator